VSASLIVELMYQNEVPLVCEFNDDNGFDGQMDFDPVPEEDDVLASGSIVDSQSVRTDFSSCFGSYFAMSSC
jgi:hypothetical protein